MFAILVHLELTEQDSLLLTSEPILRTSGLGKRYKKRWAVHELDLEVFRGDVFGFLGPNGAGKSTTIRMLLSLIRPTTGDIHLFGHRLSRERSAALQKVGGIVEKPDFYLYLSAYRNLEILGALHGGVRPSRIFEGLQLVGLKERVHDKVKSYSHGMKQRLGIAQALLSDPELVVLDEPTNGLDPQGMKEVRDLIHRLVGDFGKTIFLSSHLLSEIEMVANRMAILDKGELIVQGEVASLLQQGEQYVIVKGTPRTTIRSVLRTLKIVTSFKEHDGQFDVVMSFKDIPLLASQLVRKGVSIGALVPKRSLEDFFLSITEGNTIT